MESQHECMVCGKPTEQCPPSPFLPYSGWRCEECQKARRIPLQDLLGLLRGLGEVHNYDEAVKDYGLWWSRSTGCKGGKEYHPPAEEGEKYAEKYWLPTMEFFGLTKDAVWEKVEEFARKYEFSAFGDSQPKEE